jgi:hypothetical protein
MKISTSSKIKALPLSETKEPSKKKAPEEKDARDLEHSLTDWNAEHNQSGRHK